ncbi:B12-binding domain-containing radical SAM protein [Aureivirga sp. CE67]|uniref:B12-binding domain-containing radical SAM protein n=1 Tax=Aureivirga sp. CE67 TaxID=1788983 RepID=UPI0018CB5B9B|nr:radical SAM protein [Aureivirga sp. CE67]
MMKVYLIKASAGSEYSKYKAETGGPPQNIFSAAATTPDYVEIEMCDETIGMKTDFDSTADIVAIFMSTPDAYRAYEIAEKFSKKGKTIVLGGLHTHFMPEEAKEYADTILIGEIEGIWEELLEDYCNGFLKKSYQRKTAFDLKDLKPYPTHILTPEKYDYTWSVVVSRGCPFKCDFCLVHKFFKKFQLRPIDAIVNEVRALKELGVEWVELHSDNLTQNKEYTIELFEALAPLNMNFFGETTIMIARDEKLLAAAQKAGVKSLLFGIETPSETALKEQGKAFVKPNKIKEYVQIIKSYGIEVVGDFLFGFDAHDTNIFQETLDFVKDIEVDKAYPHLMIPFPGSETFERLDKENRIITKDWSLYEGSHAVFQPKQMTPKELEDGLWWFWYENLGILERIKYMFNN